MKRYFKFILSGMLLLVFPLLTGCLIPSDQEISAQLAAALRQQFKPREVSVALHRSAWYSSTIKSLDITMSDFALTGGRLQRTSTTQRNLQIASLVAQTPAQPAIRGKLVRIIDARLHCDNFAVEGLPVKGLQVALHEAKVPLGNAKDGELVIASAKSATGSVTFTDAGLTTFLATQHLPLDDAKLHITPDGCLISGKTRGLVRVPVEVAGKLAVKDGAVVYLAAPALRVSSVPLPKFVADQLLKEVNPLADLNTLQLPAPLTITQTQHGNGELRFEVSMGFPQPEE